MDELKILVWIIVGAIYLISRFRKKQNASAPKPMRTEATDAAPENKPLSFEDLLREIQAAKAPKPVPVPAKTADYKDYDDDVEADEKPLEKADFDYKSQDEIYSTYEKAKQEAFNRPSLEETEKLPVVVKFGQFDNYKRTEVKSPLAAYIKDLQDKEGFKKAFIFSEILSRKKF